MNLYELDNKMAQRPGYGKEGRPIKLKTNYLKVVQFPNISLYHYSFDVAPKINKQTINKIYYEVANKNNFGKFFAAFDGNSSIYSSTPLPLANERKGNKFKVVIGSNGDKTIKKGSYEATVKFIETLSLDRLRNYISSQGPITRIYPPSPKNIPIILSSGVELKQGFYQSLRPGCDQLFINIDICAAVFYPSGSLPEVIGKILSKRSTEELRFRGLSNSEIILLSKYLKNLNVETLHHHNRKPVYKIKRITKESADNLKFYNDEKNSDMSISEYFLTKYEITLKFPNLPCILVNRGIYLPIEVCYVLPGQRFEGPLPDITLSDMIKHTCVKPQERFQRILNAVSDVFQHDRDPHLESIGMEVDCKNMVVLNGRVLNPPRLTFNEKNRQSEFIPENGQRSAPQQLVKSFMKRFREIANQKGMNIPNDPYVMYANPQGEITTALNIACHKSLFNKNYPPHIIICILGATGPIYGEIKRIGDTQLGVPTQCILLKRLTRKNGIDQICSNIFLKVNAKLGGQNVILTNDQIGFVSSEPTMIFGADVFHSGRGDNKPSIAAVCASLDSKATKYAGRFSVNRDPRNEIIEDLKGIVIDLLRVFYQRNQVLPRKILFYRDGVGENQFQHVKTYEVKVLKEVFASVYRNSGPTLTFIILQKRHHTRFMPTEPREGDKLGNCRPGTVVDRTILVEQDLQGTSRPIHYNVLHDENDFTADGIQTLTYRLCYLSARCTLSISQVPAVYYAHLIANRAKHYFRWDGDEKSDLSRGSGGSSVGSIEEVKNGLTNAMFFI
ncbi:10341_t:CDS:10 [Rhizophagus irregularis]|nr:10341_t:CDS:10 [Rhizophagus irregularis]